MKTLNIIGAGRLGQSLGKLWHEAEVFEIKSVLCRSQSSAEKAVAFIGAGKECWDLSDMNEADVYLVSTPDQEIVSISEQLKDKISEHSIIFHCGGVLSSLELNTNSTVLKASVHPVHSFADPSVSVQSFAGTKCGVEGDEDALSLISKAFEQIGAEVFQVDSDQKALYHAAAVMACNYTVVLQQLAIDMYEKSGLSTEDSMRILKPIMEGTIQNIFNNGVTDSLTGPVARGDVGTVDRHIAALETMPKISDIYRQLGIQAVHISRNQGNASTENLDKIIELLEKS